MVKTNDSSLKVVEYLLQIKAIKIQLAKPFTWASGWKSPIYCDNRKILSYPKIRTFIRQEFSKMINDIFGTPDVIAGIATGGIPHGVLVAQELGLPFIYVRTSAKEHGLGNQIEGYYEPKQTVVMIEDLVSTGGTSLQAVKAVRDEGLEVKGLISIFNYGFSVAETAFKKAKCPMYSLSNYEVLLEQALKTGFINEKDVLQLNKWRENPENWGKE